MPRAKVAQLSELEDGEPTGVDCSGTELLLIRQGARVRAYERYCLHQRTDLADGIVSDGHLVCALHGWRFRLEDGALDLQPQSCLRMYTVTVDGDDIWVDTDD